MSGHLFVALVLAALRASDAEAPRTLTLAEALSMADRNGFDAILADFSAAGARADLEAAEQLVNPLASASEIRSSGVPASGGPMSARGYSVSVSDQGLLENAATRKRSLRIDAARSVLAAASSNRVDARRVLRFEVTQAYFQVGVAEKSERIESQLAESFGRTLDLVRKRYELGAVSEAEVDRLLTAKLEAEQNVADQTARIVDQKALLWALLGGPAAASRPALLEISESEEETDDRRFEGATFENLVDEAVGNRPDVAAEQDSLDRAQSALRLARRARLPDTSISATYAREGPEQSPITPPTFTLGVSLELPILNFHRAEVARAQADVSAAKAVLEKSRVIAAADVASAWTALEAAVEKIRRMKTALRDSARRSRELSEIQYRAGTVSLIDLLDAERTALAVELENLQDDADVRVAVARLETAIGRDVTP